MFANKPIVQQKVDWPGPVHFLFATTLTRVMSSDDNLHAGRCDSMISHTVHIIFAYIQCVQSISKENAMFNNRSFALTVISSIILSACFAPVPQGSLPAEQQLQQPAPAEVVTATVPVGETNAVGANAEHHSDVDVTHLELGDGKASSSPKVGYVYSCMTSFNSSGGGAGSPGNWLNGDGTWDATKKAVIDGSVTWPSSFTVSIQGNQRVFSGNDLPDHPTGNFPVSPSDDAYAYDRNPNSIKQQSISLSLPASPTAAASPNCVGGEVGIMLSGVVIFSAFDAEGRDAPAHEVQDTCDGHPQVSGFYHYHSLSDCIVDNASGHSALAGYAFDGYGIYGYYGEDGEELTNADLDECHGHTHMIEWNGQMVEMYHYHATREFPYVVGCFHGTPAVRALSASEGQGGAQGQSQGGQPQQPAGGPSTQDSTGAQGNGQQPPQQALDACIGLTQNTACTVTTPNGTLNGTCMLPPGSTQLACVPAGGPPP
jgi:YHYH protein